MILLSLKIFVTTLKFFWLNIINFWTKFGNKLYCRLRLQLHSIYIYIYIYYVNCEKFIIGLHFLLISSIFAKFKKDQISIGMLSIKFINFEFL